MKYIVTINDKSYEVEVEKGTAEVLHITTAVPPPTHAPAAVAPAAPAAPVAPAPAKPVSGEVVAAPMPGVIVNILKKPGDPVKRGDTILTMEAMKMENEIAAPRDGVVAQILTAKGATVSTGTPLASLQ
jgi:glutaconyl-CoA/methylmalonyl-CoA decarboxylase subunit gamma